jgi:hypothetical protein
VDVKKLYSEQADPKTELNLSERLPWLVGGLNVFLEKLQEKKPGIYDDYLIALEKKLLSLITGDVADLETISIPGVQESIQQYSVLQKLYFKHIIQLLEIPGGHSSGTIELPWSKSLKAQLYPIYYRASVLCDIMGREEAIDYLKVYIDETRYEQIQPNLELEDLNHCWENWKEEEGDFPSDAIVFRINKGRMGKRTNNCSWYEVMKPFEDSELSHIVACYGDTSGFQAQNPNFVHTRTTTLMEGGPYCDSCMHDKRHISEIEHPSQEFYQNLDAKLGE